MARKMPKPRLAVYGGAAGSLLVAAGETGKGFNVRENIAAGSGKAAIAKNLAAITSDFGAASAVAAPAVVGVGVSWLADKVGLNRVLAKARAPFRI